MIERYATFSRCAKRGSNLPGDVFTEVTETSGMSPNKFCVTWMYDRSLLYFPGTKQQNGNTGRAQGVFCSKIYSSHWSRYCSFCYFQNKIYQNFTVLLPNVSAWSAASIRSLNPNSAAFPKVVEMWSSWPIWHIVEWLYTVMQVRPTLSDALWIRWQYLL